MCVNIESLCSVFETIIQLYINDSLIINKKNKLDYAAQIKNTPNYCCNYDNNSVTCYTVSKAIVSYEMAQ